MSEHRTPSILTPSSELIEAAWYHELGLIGRVSNETREDLGGMPREEAQRLTAALRAGKQVVKASAKLTGQERDLNSDPGFSTEATHPAQKVIERLAERVKGTTTNEKVDKLLGEVIPGPWNDPDAQKTVHRQATVGGRESQN